MRELDKAVNALNEEMLSFKEHLSKSTLRTYDIQKPSQSQAIPVQAAYAKAWDHGRGYPLESFSTGELRAMIYDISSVSTHLYAYQSVFSVTVTNLINCALDSSAHGQTTIQLTAIRGILERVAFASELCNALAKIDFEQPAETAFDAYIAISNDVARALFGTNRNWSKLAVSDIRTITSKEAGLEQNEDFANLQTGRIIKRILALNEKVPGARVAYEVLCEFLHPNIGDLIAATEASGTTTDQAGTRHIFRKIGSGAMDLTANPELVNVLSNVLTICGDAIKFAPSLLNVICVHSAYSDDPARVFQPSSAHRSNLMPPTIPI